MDLHKRLSFVLRLLFCLFVLCFLSVCVTLKIGDFRLIFCMSDILLYTFHNYKFLFKPLLMCECVGFFCVCLWFFSFICLNSISFSNVIVIVIIIVIIILCVCVFLFWQRWIHCLEISCLTQIQVLNVR